MTEQWSLPAYAVVTPAAVLGVLSIGLLLLARRVRLDRRERAEQVARAEAEARLLRERLAVLEQRLAAAARREDGPEYVITGVSSRIEPARPASRAGSGSESDAGAAPVPAVPAPLFADLVLRESVVQAASFAAGLRRALAPESRDRIRAEMRREVRRARKQRRVGLREARREWEARRRESLRAEDSAA